MVISDNKKYPKPHKIFYCEKCDYTTCKKNEYDKHLSTSKHEKASKMIINDNKKSPKTSDFFSCEKCGNIYKYNSGLSRHKKICNNTINVDNTNTNPNDIVFDKDFVLMVLKQNTEILKSNQEVMKENNELKSILVDTQNQMFEVIKNGTHNTTNTNTNSHNKTFNLQFFLNETCKNAMNIMDFVESVKLQLSDLESMGDVGFVTGISNIIIKNLKDLDVHERPVHCTDKKREVLYVKDEDKWNKETDGNPKIRKAIKHIAKKNTKQLSDFKNKYPDCNKSHSKHSDKYNKLIIESMGGNGDNDQEKENKIIHNIAKEVIVDK
jgi:hypothetical protein